MIPYLIVFGATALTVFATTPLVRKLAVRFGAIDKPSDRKVHPKPTPTLGGVAIFVGVLVGLVASRLVPDFKTLFGTSSELWAIVVAGGVIVALGILDDVREVVVPAKLAGQILAAGLLVLMGVQLLYFWFPGQGILSLSPDLAVPLTIIWVLVMVNAVNLIDGLDGLAAGMVAIASIAFFLFIYRTPGIYGGTNPAALICAISAGAAVGFLPWNFYPARIFMGDSGAMLLGLLLSVATISGVGRNAYPPSGGDLAAVSIPVLVPLLVIAIPLLDVVLAIGRRVRRGSPVSHADKQHIHHRLLDIGHSHRQAVLLMYLWSALISGCALAVAFINGRLTVAVIVVVLLGIFAATAIPRLLVVPNGRRKGRHQAGSGSQNGKDEPATSENARQPA
ncbi:MAG: MraY family glycosyltransferase [Actinomycetota bacterium]